MPANIAVAVIFNLVLLLVLSWVFFILIFVKYRPKVKQNNSASGKRDRDGKKNKDALTELKQNNVQQKKSIQRIGSVLDGLDQDNELVTELQTEVEILESQLEDSLKLINRQTDINQDYQSANIEDNDQTFTVNALKFKVTNLRNDNDELQEKLTQAKRHNTRLKRYRDEHRLLANKMSEYIDSAKKSDHLIKKLQSKLIATQSAAEEAQRALERLQIPNKDADEDELKAALDRAEREKDFLEQQYMELLKQLEEAEEVSEELQRSQAECAQLEQAYMALVDEINEAENDSQSEPLGEESVIGEQKTTAETLSKRSEISEDEIRKKNEDWLNSLEDNPASHTDR